MQCSGAIESPTVNGYGCGGKHCHLQGDYTKACVTSDAFGRQQRDPPKIVGCSHIREDNRRTHKGELYVSEKGQSMSINLSDRK